MKRNPRADWMPEARVAPDCGTCVWKTECTDAEAGKFCPKWHSRLPEEKNEPDPNEEWRRGEDVFW